jgi:hypothetical protein
MGDKMSKSTLASRMLLVAVLMTLPFMALAADQTTSIGGTFNKDWYKCQQDHQCVIVDNVGCGVEWAVNKNFVEQSRKNPPRAVPVCKKPVEFHPANTVAKCENNNCVLSPRGFYAGGYPMP